MSTSLSPEEIRAAAEIHRELGPDYRDAVVESFIERVGREIDARVDSRLAAQQAAQPAKPQKTMALPIVSIALGIPLSGISLGPRYRKPDHRARNCLDRDRGDKRRVRARVPVPALRASVGPASPRGACPP